MKRVLSAIAAIAVVAIAPAEAATPVKGGTYDGRTSQGSKYGVHLKVGNTGKRITRFSFNWRAATCGSARNGAQGRIVARVVPIAAGRFSKTGTSRHTIPASAQFGGGTQVEHYRITGRFTGRTRARGTIRVDVDVMNQAGAVVDRCTMRRAATFRADRVGVTDPGDSPYAIEN